MKPSLLEAHLARWGEVAPRSLSKAAARTMTMEELLALADAESACLFETLSLGYASTAGLPVLREEIAGLYGEAGPDSVLTTAGAQEALFCAFRALLAPGDHVVSFIPCYEDLATLPAELGAPVTTIPLHQENGFRQDAAEVEAALRPGTKLIVLNSPHNPTGTTIDEADLAAIVELAAARGIYLLVDEVFRLLARKPATPIADRYERGISLDVMGKSFGLGGVRIGWLVCRDRSFLEAATAVKTHLSICNGAPDEILALIALRAADEILEGNLAVIERNLEALDLFFEANAARVRWARPSAGCLAYPGLIHGAAEDLCERMAKEEGILLFPASLFLGEGERFRIGLGGEDLPDLLPALARQLTRC